MYTASPRIGAAMAKAIAAKVCDAELISKDVETLLAEVLILCLSLNLLSRSTSRD